MADSCDYINITLIVFYLLLFPVQRKIQFALQSVLRHLEFREKGICQHSQRSSELEKKKFYFYEHLNCPN
jgi:hypothetical protein